MNGEQIWQRLRQGHSLHEQGAYDEALAIYRSILQAHPTEPYSLYEMAYTLNAQREPRQAQALLERVIAGGGGPLVDAFLLLGAIHDGLGELGLGERAFRLGLERFRDNASLHYGLGVNLLAQGKGGDATSELIANLVVRPDHARGWAVAGDALWTTNNWAWALLGWARSLTLDLDVPSSKLYAERLWKRLFAGVDVREKTLRVPPVADDADREYKHAENIAVAVTAAGRYRKWATRSDAEFFVLGLARIVLILGEFAAKGDVPPSRQFWQQHLHKFFATAGESDALETAAYVIRAPLDDPSTSAWLDSHAPEVQRFRAWSKTFHAAPAARTLPPSAP
jgi:tetratricopeptide (TPR) repeat protein